MQNVYDLAHELVRSLKETDQFKDYKDAQKALKANDQVKTMMGEAPDQDALAQLQNLYSIVMSDPLASSFFNAQMQLQTIIADIYKIIGEAVDEE